MYIYIYIYSPGGTVTALMLTTSGGAVTALMRDYLSRGCQSLGGEAHGYRGRRAYAHVYT